MEASVLSRRPPAESIDDLDALLAALPPEIVDAVHALPDRIALIEVVMDLGRRPEARFPDREVGLLDREIDEADIALRRRAHRRRSATTTAPASSGRSTASAPSATASGKIVGLTCRVGRAVFGTIEIIEDFVETGKSILIMGRPGIGKTTMLREAARVLADDMDKRVVVVDTSNEIAGDGDIPHPAIGRARRMQVRTPVAPARGDDRGGREPHARGHRHRRDRHGARGRRPRARSPSAASSSSAPRTATTSTT